MTRDEFIKMYKHFKDIDANIESDLNSVIESEIKAKFPTDDEIDEQIDKYAFRVPYDGSNEFYDEIALKHYQAGINWLKSKLT